MTNKEYFIFDMDGTVLDTMVYWRDLSKEYFKEQYNIDIPTQLSMSMLSKTTEQIVEIIKSTYNIECKTQGAWEKMLDILKAHYENACPHKPNAEKFLKKAKAAGKKMCIATATPKSIAVAALKKAGLYDYFEFVLAVEDIGIGKTKPDIYIKAMETLGGNKQNTAVFEDALYAMKTVKKEGFFLVGVEDECAKSQKDKITELSDKYIKDYSEICGNL